MNGITFNGVHSSQIGGLEAVTSYGKDFMPEMENDLLTVPKMDGVIDNGYTFKERVIPVSIFLEGENIQDFYRKGEEVARWLNTGVVKPLILDAHPDRVYFARPMSMVDPQRLTRSGFADIQFLVPKVAGYGAIVDKTVPQDVTQTYNGNYKTKPIITIEVGSNVSFLRVNDLTSNKYMLINTSFSIGDILVIDMEKRTLRKNGVDVREHLDVKSDYLIINGNYRLTVSASGSTIGIVYHERWL